MNGTYQILKNGLIIGSILASIHFAWLILIYVGYGQVFLDFIFKIHMLNSPYQIQEFNYKYAVTLLLVSFFIGFFYGVLFSLFNQFFAREIEE